MDALIPPSKVVEGHSCDPSNLCDGGESHGSAMSHTRPPYGEDPDSELRLSLWHFIKRSLCFAMDRPNVGKHLRELRETDPSDSLPSKEEMAEFLTDQKTRQEGYTQSLAIALFCHSYSIDQGCAGMTRPWTPVATRALHCRSVLKLRKREILLNEMKWMKFLMY